MNSFLLSAMVIAASIQMAHSGAGMLCRGMDMKVYDKDQMWMMECMKEVEAKTPKEALMMPCFRKCMMIKRGIVDDTGMGKKEKAAELVKMIAPDQLHGELVPQVEKCVEMHGGKVKEQNMTCDSYIPLCQCMMDSFVQTCSRM